MDNGTTKTKLFTNSFFWRRQFGCAGAMAVSSLNASGVVPQMCIDSNSHYPSATVDAGGRRIHHFPVPGRPSYFAPIIFLCLPSETIHSKSNPFGLIDVRKAAEIH
jgi:hypothetical protein